MAIEREPTEDAEDENMLHLSKREAEIEQKRLERRFQMDFLLQQLAGNIKRSKSTAYRRRSQSSDQALTVSD